MKYTNEQLIQVTSTYKTYSDLLANRKLYYLLHNRGILKDATKHLEHTKKRHRTKFTKGVVDLAKLIRPMRRYKRYTDFCIGSLSSYVILRRHGLDPKEIFENILDNNYIKNLLKRFGEEQLKEFIQK